MVEHEPMCPYSEPERDRDPNNYCQCDLIARVRADERERIAQEIEAYDAEVCVPADERCTCDAAARIARGQS